MKTPEEMAEEYCKEWWGNYLVADYLKSAVKAGFLGGYQAAKDELADADKVMCSTTMEEIKAVDTGELMPITNLPTPAKWISVKDRLPTKQNVNDIVLVWNAYHRDVSTVRWKSNGFDDVDPMYISHWMPLPEVPEDKGKAHWQELREFWKLRNVNISEWKDES